MDETLAVRLARAVEAGDHELARRLRDQLEAQGSKIRVQVPGRMGLGTSEQVFKPPPGWVKPKKPDPMTARSKRRKGEPSG